MKMVSTWALYGRLLQLLQLGRLFQLLMDMKQYVDRKNSDKDYIDAHFIQIMII